MQMRARRGAAALAVGLAGVLALCLSAQRASADLAVDFTVGSSAPGSIGGESTMNLGWEFTVSETLTIDGLGIWDQDGDGLFGSHEVGLWDLSTDEFLVSTTVTNGATPVASASSSGRWLFNSIPQLTLAPGEYVLGATYTAVAKDDACYRTDATYLPGITFVGDRQRLAVGMERPNMGNGLGNAIFGPNMRIVAVQNVPEPGSLALLGGLGVASLISVRRLKRRAR